MSFGEGQALIETRVRHLLDTVKRGLCTEALLVELDAEDKRRKALAAELAGLAEPVWPHGTGRRSMAGCSASRSWTRAGAEAIA